jgi:hypothetical protein
VIGEFAASLLGVDVRPCIQSFVIATLCAL